jgi:hypothetical protein
MTPDERERMNRICIGIQEEKDYNRFRALLHEMGELVERKEERRFPRHPKIVWQRTHPRKTLPAIVRRIVKPLYLGEKEWVEISITEADNLFREVRIENQWTDFDGQPVALKEGAFLELTFEAKAAEADKADLNS